MPLDPRGIEAFGDPVAGATARDIDLARRLATLERALASTQGWVPGDVKTSAKANPDPGWLLCNGAVVSRTTYTALFAAIGTAFGAGDGSTTFGLPNLLGRVVVGAGTPATGQGAAAKTLGGSGGNETVTLLAAESGVNGNGTTTSSGGVDHLHNGNGFNYVTTGNGGASFGSASGNAQLNSVTQTGGADRSLNHSHPLTARNADLGHSNLQPFAVLNYFIRT